MLNVAARELVNFRFHLRHRIGEIVGKAAQQIGIDHDAVAFHIHQNLNERAFQRFVNGELAVGDELRFQKLVQAQGHIGIFGGIARGLFHRHAIEGDFLLAFARHFAERDGLVA